MALITKLTTELHFNLQKTVKGEAVSLNPRYEIVKKLLSGALINEADKLWFDNERSLADSTDDDIDLNGTEADPFGDTISFTKVKGIFIHNLSTTAGDILNIGAAASNPFLLFADSTDIYNLGPDGVFLLSEPSLAGKTVTAGTGDILRINNASGNTITFDIAIWGT